MTKLKTQNCDKTKIVTKVELWQNSSCDESQIVTKVKLWSKLNCDKNQIVKKKLKKNQCDNSNCDKTREIKLWHN